MRFVRKLMLVAVLVGSLATAACQGNWCDPCKDPCEGVAANPCNPPCDPCANPSNPCNPCPIPCAK